MKEGALKWLRKLVNKSIHSIAFLPVIIAFGFIVLAIIVLDWDLAGAGRALNEQVKWLELRDPETARTIVATVVAGMISLTVFSFSMLMVVMNQATSQMSNRMLDNFISERIQKWVLGLYIGTIIYALFLLVNIKANDSKQHVPSLSVYVLLLFSTFDIFLFAYFLHHITQSFRYEQLIQRIHGRTLKALHKPAWSRSTGAANTLTEGEQINAWESGYFQGFSIKRLLKLTTDKDIVIQFLHTEGSYVLKGTPFLVLSRKLDAKNVKKMYQEIDFYYGQEIDKNPHYGFQHLTEVGVKALSPGINDPGTAILSLNALTDLLTYRLHHPMPAVITDSKGQPRIIRNERPFEDLFTFSILPVWDYGKKDRLVQQAMLRLLDQLAYIDTENRHQQLFDELRAEVEAARRG